MGNLLTAEATWWVKAEITVTQDGAQATRNFYFIGEQNLLAAGRISHNLVLAEAKRQAEAALSEGEALDDCVIKATIRRVKESHAANDWLAEFQHIPQTKQTTSGQPSEMSEEELAATADSAAKKSADQETTTPLYGDDIDDEYLDDAGGLNDMFGKSSRASSPPPRRVTRRKESTGEIKYGCPHVDAGCNFSSNSELVALEHYKNACSIGGPTRGKPETSDILENKYSKHEIITKIRMLEKFKDDNK